eukprot:gene2297-5712_t
MTMPKSLSLFQTLISICSYKWTNLYTVNMQESLRWIRMMSTCYAMLMLFPQTIRVPVNPLNYYANNTPEIQLQNPNTHLMCVAAFTLGHRFHTGDAAQATDVAPSTGLKLQYVPVEHL